MLLMGLFVGYCLWCVVVGCLSLLIVVVRCVLFVLGLPIVCSSLFGVVDCMLFGGCCLLLSLDWWCVLLLLFVVVVSSLLFRVVRGLLIVLSCCLLVVGRWSLFGGGCLFWFR